MSNTKRILVCNALNTSGYDEIEGLTPIDYWKSKFVSPKTNPCRACGTMGYDRNPIVGGHVMTVFGEPHVYITPIHEKCNKKKGNLPAFEVEMCDLISIPEEQEEAILGMEENKREIERQKKLHKSNSASYGLIVG